MSEVASTDLRVVMESITSVFTFTAQKYPALYGMNSVQAKEFAIDHSIKHAAKTTGKLAAWSEAVDHGKTLDVQELQPDVVKFVVTALNLAHVVGLSAEELAERIRTTVK